ncbi:MAG: histone deacetylase [Acidobacteria bacterium]|nr:histone deacetylase [Acidobacteriota bacterium]
MATGYVYDPIYLEHNTGQHPENPKRLVAIMAALRDQRLLDVLVSIRPRAATEDELAYVHAASHINYVERIASQGGGYLDMDTPVAPRSYDAALMAAGGTITAVDAVLDGQVASAMALVRPPGHHATIARGMGFCLFNNVAIAARHAQRARGVGRVMIIDFDVHHGNGTQDAFYADSSVFYLSTHEYPHYPGTGDVGEIGSGSGKGFTLNIPLPAGVGDGGYRRAFDEIVAPATRRFAPELILISAGYDAHWADPLAAMKLSVAGFAYLVQAIRSLADELCDGRVVVGLEGGYDLGALSAAVAATFDVLLGREFDDPFGPARDTQREADLEALFSTIKRLHRL